MIDLQSACSDEARRTLSYWLAVQTPPTSFVYFIREVGVDPPLKIGSAARPGLRCAELQCGNPRQLFVESVIVGTRALELDLHARWAIALIRGEWFGKGYQAEILAFAQHVASEQIAAHQRNDMPAFVDATAWRHKRAT